MPAHTKARRLPPDTRREQLLDAALAVLIDRGRGPVSIEEIAKQANVTRPLFYHYFRSLDDLVQALVAREERAGVSDIMATLPRGGPGTGSAAEAFLDGFAAFLDAVERNPDRFELLLTDYDHVIPLLGKRLEAARDALRHAVEATARAYSIADPELFAWTLTNLGELAGRLTIEQPNTFSRDRLMATANSLLRAIAADS